jgi:predicted transcriptional regulator of viral defense system
MPDISSSTSRMTQRELIRHLLADGSVRRSASLLADGVQPAALADALEAGIVVRTAPGAYHLASSEVPAHLLAIATACTRAAGALICLTTAAHLCGLTEETPSTVWMARPVGARVPKKGASSERVMHWSNPSSFEVGVIEDLLCGVVIRRTDPVRTVIDVFRYARYIGDQTASRIGAEFVTQGGAASSVLEMASILGTPRGTMRLLETFLDGGKVSGFPDLPQGSL